MASEAEGWGRGGVCQSTLILLMSPTPPPLLLHHLYSVSDCALVALLERKTNSLEKEGGSWGWVGKDLRRGDGGANV